MNKNIDIFDDLIGEGQFKVFTGPQAGYTLKDFSLTDENSLFVEFNKVNPKNPDKPIREFGWYNPLDTSKITEGSFGRTLAEEWANREKKELRAIASIVSNFVTKETITSIFKQVRDAKLSKPEERFVKFVTLCKDSLPDNFSETEGRLVIGYNTNPKSKGFGYTTFPHYPEWDKANNRWLPFFTVDTDATMCSLGKLSAEKPVPQSELGAADADDDF